MKQPKFKFGDVVQVRATESKPEHVFEVDDVWWDRATGTFRYGDNWPEGLLDLYQKPTTQRLYAFQSTRRAKEIIYREHPHEGNGYYIRVPQKDKYVQ